MTSTLSTKQVLQPEQLHKIRIHLPPSLMTMYGETNYTQIFIWDRTMEFVGIYKDWSSYIFKDDLKLLDGLSVEDDKTFNTFRMMAHICGTIYNDQGCHVHVCEHWHNGFRLLEVCE